MMEDQMRAEQEEMMRQQREEQMHVEQQAAMRNMGDDDMAEQQFGRGDDDEDMGRGGALVEEAKRLMADGEEEMPAQ